MAVPTILTLDREALLPVLERAAGVIQNRATIPILAYLRLKAEGEMLHITGTDLDITIEGAVAAQIEGSSLTFTAPGRMLHDIVRKLPEGRQVRVEVSPEGQVLVKSDRSRFALSTLPPDDFPDIPEPPVSHRFSLARKTLEALIGRVSFAVSTEETRFYLNGAYWHTKQGRLVSVATDGHRLALMSTEAPEGCIDMPGVIIPRSTLSEILKLLNGSKIETVDLEICPSKIILQIGAIRLISKLIDATFPDYQRVIPSRNNKVATAERDELLRAADLVSTISSKSSRAVKLRFSETALELSVANPDSGTASEEIEIRMEGDDMEIGFNARYLGDAIAAIEGACAKISLADAGSPALITSGVKDHFLTVLMPMRV